MPSHGRLASVPAAQSLESVLPHFLSNGNKDNADDQHHESERQHERTQEVGVRLGNSSEVEASKDQAAEQHTAAGADQHDGVAVEVEDATPCSSVPRKAEHRAVGVRAERFGGEGERERTSNGERVLGKRDELQRRRG